MQEGKKGLDPADLAQRIVPVHVTPAQQVLLLLQLHHLSLHLHVNCSLHSKHRINSIGKALIDVDNLDSERCTATLCRLRHAVLDSHTQTYWMCQFLEASTSSCYAW